MKIKKIHQLLWIFTLISLLLCSFTISGIASAATPNVVFVSENGSDSNSGTSESQALKSFQKVFDILDGKGGIIVVCGDVAITDGAISTTSTKRYDVPEQTGKLTITGKYNGVDYNGKLMLGAKNNGAKIILGFLSDTYIGDLEICYNCENKTGTSAEIWSGTRLEIGGNVKTSATGKKNKITIRTGLYGADCEEAWLTVLAGEWNYIQGGNSRKNVGTSHLTFGGTALAQYIQCGGTNTNVNVSKAEITGGSVAKALYVNGYGTSTKIAQMNTSNITISGGEITALFDARNVYSPVSGTVTLTFTGNGADHVNEIDMNRESMVAGHKEMIFNDTCNPVIQADLSSWDDVVIKNEGSVTFLTEYHAPAETLTIEAGCQALFNAALNDTVPQYAGAGTASLTYDISRTHPNYTESFVMALENPKKSDGTDTDKEQGMALWGNEIFVFQNGGLCKVYDLNTKESNPVSTFMLGSYNTGTPSSAYENHCNTVMFGENHYVDPQSGIINPIPLLYVRTGNDSGQDDVGYYNRLAIENIERNESNGVVTFSSSLLQTIIYSDYYDGTKTIDDYNSDHNTSYVPVAGFGSPMWLVDTENQALYILSAKYRTIYGAVGDTDTYPGYISTADNYYVITKFELPNLHDGSQIVLTPMDIIDQFTTSFTAFATQGGTLYDNKIIYTFGFGQIKELNPNKIVIFDLAGRQIQSELELWDSMFAFDEIESCVVFGDSLLVNTQDGYIYRLSKTAN